jgi:hypothetical protein
LAVLKTLKGEILHSPANMNDNSDHVLARFYLNQAPVYVQIQAEDYGNRYQLFIIEQKEFQPSIVTSPGR